ncbi:MAG: SAM-dependent methyltransferase [Candidatus Rokuibacteriota bacterium]|nr:MAG: SAM-dependent methyltransferase [Candidatus Rokubacteria bacterium]
MGLYQRYILPRLIDLSMQNRAVRAERARFVPLASGTVLEVGLGSGLNLPFYSPAVERLYGLDPSLELQTMARRRARDARLPVEFIAGSGERIPMEDETVDAVVTTWTLCSIPDPVTALTEMKRVLNPGGRLIFIEHGRSPDARVVSWQDRLTPVWRRLAGGCHLNRKIDALILAAGFRIAEIETAYMKGPKPLVYLYKGVAQRSS